MSRPNVLYRMISSGMDGWSRLLPICASAVLTFISFFNLVGSPKFELIDLRSFLHISEILVLTLLSPLWIMRHANVLAIFLISYLLTKLSFMSEPITEAHSASLVLFCCLGIIMTLGDRLPWLRKRHDASFGAPLRSVLLIFISLASCGVVLVTMFKVGDFARWLVSHAGISLAPQALLIGLALQLVLWLMVSLSVTSPMVLSLLALPTFAAALYLTGLTSTVLMTPFIICLALATTLPARQQLS